MPELIPNPPRRVRLRAAMRRRWVLGLVSGAMLLLSVPILLILAISGVDPLPFADDALDEQASTTRGIVTAVEPTSVHSGSRHFTRIRYRFHDHEDREWLGAVLVDHVEVQAGSPCTVEYLAQDPELNRLEGTRRTVFGTYFGIFIGVFGLPTVALFLMWLRGVVRCRLVLREGTRAVAKITECRRLRGVNPPQLKVRYEFEDAARQLQTGSHWVGARSRLGKALDAGELRADVVYDENDPLHSRLVTARDFG